VLSIKKLLQRKHRSGSFYELIGQLH